MNDFLNFKVSYESSRSVLISVRLLRSIKKKKKYKE